MRPALSGVFYPVFGRKPSPSRAPGRPPGATPGARRRDPDLAQRNPRLTAEWLGGDRSVVEIAGKRLGVNGTGELSPMQLILAGLASCEIDVIATHAALLGLAVTDITVELDAHFDARRYLGVEGPPPGYDRIAYRVSILAPAITDANTLARRVEIVPALEVTRSRA